MEIPDTTYHRVIKWLCISLQAGTVLFLILKWKSLPEEIPMHYNGAGEIDGYGAKWTVWITPVIMILMYQFLYLIERHPNWWNTGVNITKGNSERVYGVLKNMIVSLKLVVMLIFGYISISGTTGENLSKWFTPGSLLLTFGIMIIFLILLIKASKEN